MCQMQVRAEELECSFLISDMFQLQAPGFSLKIAAYQGSCLPLPDRLESAAILRLGVGVGVGGVSLLSKEFSKTLLKRFRMTFQFHLDLIRSTEAD